jgi:hypothetical protein
MAAFQFVTGSNQYSHMVQSKGQILQTGKHDFILSVLPFTHANYRNRNLLSRFRIKHFGLVRWKVEL